MAQAAVFSVPDAEKVAKATKMVLAKSQMDADFTSLEYVVQPTLRVKITGALSGGLYPAKIVILNPETLAWTELGDCYAKKADTI